MNIKFNPGQNIIIIRKGLSSTKYIKDETKSQQKPIIKTKISRSIKKKQILPNNDI
jgi:hypothetical protein